ncbi:MAG: acyltransferase family protein, partial [Planctomycetia bacterium]|nr:acyltransferase family protein [Planctomycetia bacterium]
MSTGAATKPRIVSLDQFRGYTVLGMFLVNFVGSLEASHYLLRHHNTFCSYADTIMPQFFFAVGFAFRLTFRRRIESDGPRTAYFRVIRRLLGLILLALVVYSVDRGFDTWRQLTESGFWEAIKTPLKRDWFQTLTHIAVTSLWVLPVIRARASVRIAFMLASAGLHAVLSHVFYFHWLHAAPSGIDGGPLGFLTWTIPVIVGTLACDVIVRAEDRHRVLPLAFWSVALMALGYLLSCGARLYDIPGGQAAPPPAQKLAAEPVVPSGEQLDAARRKLAEGRWPELLAEPPFVPPPHPPGEIGRSYEFRQENYWMMSQRAGTLSYLTFASGFSLAVYVLFYLCCDRWGRQLGVLRTLGMNALAAYVLHMLVEVAIRPFVPSDSPAWYAWSACLLFLAITYLLVRSLERQNIYLKL